MTFRLLLLVLLVMVASGQDQSASQPLFTAIHRGSVADVERLLKSGVSANAMDGEGTPALMAATLFGNVRLMQLLLDHGADPNRAGPAGTTALMWAVPHKGKVQLLLARGANVNARSESQRTALLVAAYYPGTVELLRYLLDQGADLRAQDRAGANALSLATRAADVEVVRFLVGRGLDAGSLSSAAQRVAFTRPDLPTTEYLATHISKPPPELLIAASAWLPVAPLARWIELGVNVNTSVPDAFARTALLTAVTSETAGAGTLELLLSHGADPNAAMSEGESPLDWAIYKGDRAKIQILEKYGAKQGKGPRSEAINPPPKNTNTDGRVALSRGIPRLLDVAPTFREKTPNGCISCHHNTMPALAAAAAKAKGIGIDDVRARKNLDDLFTFFKSNAPRMMLGDPAVGGDAITAGYTQLALAANGYGLDTVTATITHWLLARQMPAGNWIGTANRPPSEYSSITHTALAAGGLKAYTPAARLDEVAESLRRARRWLLQAQPKSSEERAMRLMGLVWTDAPRDRISAALKEIRDHQEPDGGWSQFGRTPPDAYATGQSLYALHAAGMRATDNVYRKGVRFLLETQYPDGTWLVKTHAFPVQRYFESGFPFGRHQWISTAGTSWAVLAIAQTLAPAF